MAMQTTSLLQKQFEAAITAFKESGLNSMAIPGANGFFITCDKEKGKQVIYVDEINVDGVDYFAYSMNPAQ